jgi:quercetin dioxygenase-like cupin family protein
LHHVDPTEIVALAASPDGEARHVALVKTDQFEALRLRLKAGEGIPAHQVPGYCTIQCVQGSVEIVLSDRAIEMATGDWLYLDHGQEHAVRAPEETVLLVTIML